MIYFFIIIGLLILWGIADIIYDVNTFRVTPYTVRSDKIKKRCQFVVISDLHNKTFGKKNVRLLKKIDELHPDAVIIAGDLLTCKAGEDYRNAAELAVNLRKKYPVYYGVGNHEHKLARYPERFAGMSEEYLKLLSEGQVYPMQNESVLLDEYGVRISGLVLDLCFFKHFKRICMEPDYISTKLGRADTEHFQILIAHNPDYFEDYAAWGADLVLSGHNHGGIVDLPFLGGVISPRVELFPKYDSGRFTEGGAEMLLSRGLGTHTLPVRVLNHAELLFVTLET